MFPQRNSTPIKLFPNENENMNNIISPYKEHPFSQTNFNMGSPDNNLRFISPMKNIGLISSEKKIINDKNFNNIIQGKKIDFNDDLIFNENEPIRNQNGQNIIINNINNQNINYKQNISLNNKKIINRAYISVQPLNINNNNNASIKPKCTCSKTSCLKKYCACFANGVPCEGCDCKNCENVTNKTDNIYLSEKVYPLIQSHINKNQRIICNCTKSNCMKKYCECFKQGFNCNSLCRCVECKNKISTKDENIQNNNNIPEFMDFSGSFFPNNENENINESNKIDYRLPLNYQTEAFGICVRKEKLKIDDRNCELGNITPGIDIGNNYELNATPKFSKRKRLRSKNESANLKTCPTTNSSNKKGRSLSSSVNKNIQKKKLQLN